MTITLKQFETRRVEGIRTLTLLDIESYDNISDAVKGALGTWHETSELAYPNAYAPMIVCDTETGEVFASLMANASDPKTVTVTYDWGTVERYLVTDALDLNYNYIYTQI